MKSIERKFTNITIFYFQGKQSGEFEWNPDKFSICPFSLYWIISLLLINESIDLQQELITLLSRLFASPSQQGSAKQWLAYKGKKKAKFLLLYSNKI